jgi:hypothetical protein
MEELWKAREVGAWLRGVEVARMPAALALPKLPALLTLRGEIGARWSAVSGPVLGFLSTLTIFGLLLDVAAGSGGEDTSSDSVPCC